MEPWPECDHLSKYGLPYCDQCDASRCVDKTRLVRHNVVHAQNVDITFEWGVRIVMIADRRWLESVCEHSEGKSLKAHIVQAHPSCHIC